MLPTINDSRISIEAAIESLRAQQERDSNTKVNFAFAFAMQPGEVNSSTALSLLNALLSAVKQFPSDHPCNINVRLSLIHPDDEQFNAEVQSRIQSVRALHQG